MAAQPALSRMAGSVLQAGGRLASHALRQATAVAGVRLVDDFPRELCDDIFACALKKQTGVSLKYM